MSDDAAKIILGDAAIASLEEGPRRRRRSRKKEQAHVLTHCENCGAELQGHWCAHCGQAAVDYRRSFRHLVTDLLDSFLNWDSKFVATVWWLLVRPWRLTIEFVNGHRVRYVHPLRIYLLASVSFFFAATYAVKTSHFETFNLSPENRDLIRAELDRGNVAPEVRAKIEAAITGQPLPENKRAKIERSLQRSELPPEARTALENRLRDGDLPPHAREQIEAAMKDLPPDVRANIERTLKKDVPGIVFDDKKDQNDAVGKWFEQRAKEKFGEHGSNLQLFLVTLMSNLPYMMLVCVPLFALVLKLLYIRRKTFYIDHLVYALHIHSFAYLAVMLLVVATIGTNRFIPHPFAGLLIAVMWAVFGVQVFLSIRRVYGQSWFVTVFKFFLGGSVYLLVLITAVVTTFLVTIVLPS